MVDVSWLLWHLCRIVLENSLAVQSFIIVCFTITVNQCSQGEFLRKFVSLSEPVLASVGLAIDSDAPSDVPLAVGEEVLLSPLLVGLAALEDAFGRHCLLGLLPVFVGVDRRGFYSLAVLYVLLLALIDHEVVQIARPPVLEERLEEIVVLGYFQAVAEEVVEDVVGSDGDHGAEDEVIVVLASELITQPVVGLVDRNKLLAGLLAFRFVLRVVLEGQFSVSLLDFLHGGVFLQPKGGVVVADGFGTVLAEKLLLFWVLEAVLIEEAAEGGVGVFEAVLPGEQLVVVGALVAVRKHFVGLGDLLKFGLGGLSVLLVFVRVPLGC